MKLYRPLSRRLRAQVQRLRFYMKRSNAGPLDYMTVKELSEQMERARTAAQYSILRYKYDKTGSPDLEENMRAALARYDDLKQEYYTNYHAYLEQCRDGPANDRPSHSLTKHNRRHA